MARIGSGIAVIPSQIPGARGLQDSKDFYYLTGIAEPDAVLLLWPTAEKREVYFNRAGKWPRTTGTPVDARPLTELRAFISRSAADKTVHLPFSALEGVLQAAGGAAVLAGAVGTVNLDPVLAEMRIVKTAEEIALLQAAIDITAEGYREMLKAARPGMTELDLKALLDYVHTRRGATASFTQVASGPNSVNIHFGATGREMKAGDLIVFDLGAWREKYTSDISRTIPVSGRFSKEQAALHEVVLSAQLEGIAAMTAGNGIQAVQTKVEDALLLGLARLGLVTDASKAWQRRFYIQHGFIHGIGLEVHDVIGWFARQMRAGLAFQPGMVLTMEPGLYFAPGRLDKAPAGMGSQVPADEWKAFVEAVGPVYERFEGMGCRIEDDVLVLESGNRVLSEKAPKTAADIEKTMKMPSPFKPGR